MAGAPVAKTPHFALHRASLDSLHEGRRLFPVVDTWVGVLLPKRWAKRAITRNAIRRQIYETARLRAQTVGLPEAALVVRLRTAFSRQTFVSATSDALKQAVRAELEQLYAQLARRTKPAPRPEAARGTGC